ncbi:MAG: hypothetical protein ACM3N5_09800 [Candidatus Eiseniibacteriota bacterium]
MFKPSVTLASLCRPVALVSDPGPGHDLANALSIGGGRLPVKGAGG